MFCVVGFVHRCSVRSLSDMWTVDLTSSTPVVTPVFFPPNATIPSARASGGALFNNLTQDFVIFGGQTQKKAVNGECVAATYFDDVWSYNLLTGTCTHDAFLFSYRTSLLNLGHLICRMTTDRKLDTSDCQQRVQ